MAQAVDTIAVALSQDKALLVCGNGGAASGALHIAGDLVAQFMKKRRALKAICLGANMAALTAWANDCSYESAYARQVEAFGEPGSDIGARQGARHGHDRHDRGGRGERWPACATSSRRRIAFDTGNSAGAYMPLPLSVR